MAILTTYFPNQELLPGFDYIPSLAEFIAAGYSEFVTTTTTEQVRSLSFTNPSDYRFGLSFVFKLTGAGFQYGADGLPIGGTISGLQFFKSDGTTLLHNISGLNIPLEDFYDYNTAFGNDSFSVYKYLMAGNDTLVGPDGPGFAGADLYGYDGNDTLTAGTEGAYMEGGRGADTYNGGSGYDTLGYQESYFDNSATRGVVINAVAGTATDPWGNNETFSGIDDFRGTQFADKMTGSGADESFRGLGGRDTIDGGGGFDRIDYSRDARFGGNNGVTVSLTAGTASDGFGRLDTLLNIENVRGTNFADTITGNGAKNYLVGLDGIDTLNGLGGDDTLDGGAGADKMAGGSESDYYYVDNAADTITEANVTGFDTVESNVSFSLSGALSGQYIEKLIITGLNAINATGNGLANEIIGNDADNVLDGKGNADTMTGGGGSDTYFVDNVNDKVVEVNVAGKDTVNAAVNFTLGGSAFVEVLQTTAASGAGAINLTGNGVAQTITGNVGVNALNGLGGADVLNGLAGKDTLTGGTGTDAFQFTTALNAATNIDAIADFSVADDVVQLSRAVFTALTGTVLSSTAFWSSDAGIAHDDSDRIVYDTDSGALFYDADGNKAGGLAAIQFATVGLNLALTNADFALIA